MANNKGGRPRLNEDEKRNCLVRIKFNKEEYLDFVSQFRRSRSGSLRKYVLDLAHNAHFLPEITDLQTFDLLNEIYTELQHLGRNINQIAKKVNSFNETVSGSVIEYELRKCNEQMEYCQRQADLLKEIGDKIIRNIQ